MRNLSVDMPDSENKLLAPYFAPRRLGHINILISDLETSMDFYSNVVGIEEVYRLPAFNGGFLSNGNTHHDVGMVEASGPAGRGRQPGLNHLAFELENEVSLVAGYWRSIMDGVTYSHLRDHDITHSAYCVDPDGFHNELYADVVKNWRSARQGTVTKAKPEWWPGKTLPIQESNYHVNPERRRVDHAVFHPLRTKHATHLVSDLKKSVQFYQQRVGLKIQAQGSDYAILGGTCNERNLTLIQAQPDETPRFHHAGLQVESLQELHESINKWQARGGVIEHLVEHELRTAAYIRDPDGMLLQFFVDASHLHDGWNGLGREEALWLC